MDRGAWWATVHGVAESDLIRVTEHVGGAINDTFPINADAGNGQQRLRSQALDVICLWRAVCSPGL